MQWYICVILSICFPPMSCSILPKSWKHGTLKLKIIKLFTEIGPRKICIITEIVMKKNNIKLKITDNNTINPMRRIDLKHCHWFVIFVNSILFHCDLLLSVFLFVSIFVVTLIHKYFTKSDEKIINRYAMTL